MKFYSFFWVALFFLLPVSSAFAWGTPHIAITKAAIQTLPPAHKKLLAGELVKLGDDYCLIPDHVYSDKENARFAKMESKPDVLYLLNLHLPAQQEENLETLRYFMGKAVEALRVGKVGEAARFMGTVCHQLEDYGSPAHTVPGDNMFTLLQQFLPPSEGMKGQLLHSPIESGDLVVSIPDYQAKLLGVTVEEAAWRLLHRVNEGILNARSTTIPIIQALYAEDAKAVKKWQLKAATMDAQIVADALYTILSIGSGKIVQEDRRDLQKIQISGHLPLEAESLYYPQSQFFSKPNWGCPQSGLILAQGKQVTPLSLRIEDAGAMKVKAFAKGISAGMGKSLTFLLPKGVYQNFRVWAGLHPDLGKQGRVEFAIIGDGKTLVSVTVDGSEPARLMQCKVDGLKQIELKLSAPRADGIKVDAKNNYAIWAEPTLLK